MSRTLLVRYIGWQGHGNVGDDLLFELWRDRLDGVELVVDPANTVDAVLVGGGTLLLQPDWISVFERVQAEAPGVPWFAVGLGAQDPTFCPPANVDAMLERWRQLLPRFERLSVRGPLSASYLASAGMNVPVIGDPGLATTPAPQKIPSQPRVAINLAGAVAVGRFGAPDALAAAIAEYVTNLRSLGIDITLLPLFGPDIKVLQGLASLVSLDGITMAEPTIESVKQAIATSSVVVCERLHAGCVAAVSGVPFIQVAYQPKCFDFAASINWPHALPANACDPTTLTERTTGLLDNWIENAVALTMSVARVRRTVEAELSIVEAAIRGLGS
jgi:Polysaccharide pyruvyl transferase